jgi:hypothetical protein
MPLEQGLTIDRAASAILMGRGDEGRRRGFVQYKVPTLEIESNLDEMEKKFHSSKEIIQKEGCMSQELYIVPILGLYRRSQILGRGKLVPPRLHAVFAELFLGSS